MEIRVSSSSPAIEKPRGRGENGELTWDIKFSANLIRQGQGGQGSKDGSLKETAQQKYCSRLGAILRKLEGDDETFWNLCADLKWLPSQAEKMSVKLFGKLLGRFEEVCGDGIQMTLSFSCNTKPPMSDSSRTYRDFYVNFVLTDGLIDPSFYEGPQEPIKSTFVTKGMRIIVPSMMNTSSGGICREDCSKIVPFCEDTEVKISGHLKESLLRERFEQLTCSIEATISLITKDDYINYNEIIMDKPCISKMIFQQRIHCDLSIVAANNAVLPCHKSYLAVHSTAFERMLEGDYMESQSNRIELLDVSEPCVKALLEYVYCWDITKAVGCSKLAVELFKVAHKYDINSLEKKLSAMFLQRANQWFDTDAAVDVFCFSRKIGANYNDLKLKAAEVLKSKGELLTKSENYSKMFKEDWEAAMEWCAVALSM